MQSIDDGVVEFRPSMRDFMVILQKFVALESVGPSAMRNQGKGVLAAVRSHLTGIDLGSINENPNDFKSWLDKQTDSMLDALEELDIGRPWGTARKALNLFLRTCLYNHYLRTIYGLERLEESLEIPLDRVVSVALKREARKRKVRLPKWPCLKRLTPEVSEQYQHFAETLATMEMNSSRVHLDIILWTQNR